MKSADLILPNDVQILIFCLSYIITTVQRDIFLPFKFSSIENSTTSCKIVGPE